MASPFKRTRLWINAAFQFRLLVRMGYYLIVASLVVLQLAFVFEGFFQKINGDQTPFGDLYLGFLQRHQFLIYGWILLLPWLFYDGLKFSHRVAGPLYRCRKMMLEMADGKTVPHFKPRKHDLLPEFFEAFNLLITHCNSKVPAAGNGEHPPADSNGTAHEKTTPSLNGNGAADHVCVPDSHEHSEISAGA